MREVLWGARVFQPREVVIKRSERYSWDPNELHVLGIDTCQGFLRFAPILDDATFARLTYYNGLPERWVAWHLNNSYTRRSVLALPIITVGMWERIHDGGDPELDNSFFRYQDPLPLLREYALYAQAVKQLRVIPSTIPEAKAYIRKLQQRNPSVSGGLFAVAVADLTGTVRGVAIVERSTAQLTASGKMGERGRCVAEIDLAPI